MSLTLDANCINAKQLSQLLNKLEDWQRNGLIAIFSSTSVEEELLKEPDTVWRSKRLRKLNSYSGRDAAYWVLGFSRLGISTKLGSDSTQREMEEMASIMFPSAQWKDLTANQVRDVMALHTHWTHVRDVFVTLNTRDFIRQSRSKALKHRFGVAIMTPEEAVHHVTRMIGRAQPSDNRS